MHHGHRHVGGEEPAGQRRDLGGAQGLHAFDVDGAEGAGALQALRAQLVGKLAAHEVAVAAQPRDDRAGAVAEAGIPLGREVLPLHRGQEPLGIERHVQEADQPALPADHGDSKGDDLSSGNTAGDHVRDMRPEARPHRRVDRRLFRSRQRRAPSHPRVHHLLAVGVAEQDFDAQRLQAGAGLGVHRRPIACGNVGRGGESGQMSKQQGELAIDVVGEIADELFQAPPGFSFLRLPVAIEQDSGEGQRRHHQAGAEQEQQQGNAEATPGRRSARALRHPITLRFNVLLPPPSLHTRRSPPFGAVILARSAPRTSLLARQAASGSASDAATRGAFSSIRAGRR